MRALDVAKAKLDSLSERNAILDCFFAHGRGLFQFSVLFIVKGPAAQGRNVHGLGGHNSLITRLTLPLDEPGIMRRARELRRPFVTTTGVSDADMRLFGSIGRAMPAGVVVPLVMRDRVVAIFLGDGPVEPLQRRGAELNRNPAELAKDEMLLWSEAVSGALENLILRRKGSIRPPPQFSGSAAPPAMGDPSLPFQSFKQPPLPGAAATLSRPPPADLPVWNLPGDDGYDDEAMPVSARGEEPSPRRTALYLVGIAVTAVVLIGCGIYLWTAREEGTYRTITAGEKLTGWPHVEPLSVLDAARAASGAGAGAELSSVQAEIGKDARVDFTEPPKNNEGTYVTYIFVTPDSELNVRIDKAGVQSPMPRARTSCGERPCRGVVKAPPQCTFAQIREAAVGVGLGVDERALVTYADRRESDSKGAESALGWSVTVPERGVVHFDAATCKPIPRERLFPLPIAASALPGGPREVDPMAALPVARKQSGLDTDAVLLEIEARGVASTGKVDLTSGDGGINFVLADPPSVPAATRRWREVLVDKTGMHLKPITGWQPMPSRFAADIMPPVCSFAHAFKTIGAVPSGATATIRYGRGSGSAESGELDVSVPSAGLHHGISDADCAASEKLSHK